MSGAKMTLAGTRRAVDWFSIVNYLFLSLVTLTFIIPLWTTLAVSFVGEQERIQRGAFILVPRVFDITAYRYIFRPGSAIFQSYMITVFRIVAGTLSAMVVTAMLAYALAKRSLPFRRSITMYIFIAMIFSGGLIPYYILVTRLGFTNNILVYIIPQLVNPFWMFLMRNFFMQIPQEVEESAYMDGATPAVILIRIIVPISIPAMATIGLFYAVSQWLAWFDAFLFMNRIRLMPVQNYLRNLLFDAITDPAVGGEGFTAIRPPTEAIKAAAIVVTTVPITLIYPFIQKHFVKGIMVGSIKG